MSHFHIFVEGDADKVFIQCLSSDGIESGQIDVLGGWAFNDKSIQKIKEKIILEKRVLLIVDADKIYSERLKYYNEKREELGIDFDLFLMPNNTDEGNLENSYEVIALRKEFWKCFHEYEKCISEKGFQKTLPKSKIYGYLEALRTEENHSDIFKGEYFKESIKNNFDFTNPYLDPLKAFLNKVINPSQP